MENIDLDFLFFLNIVFSKFVPHQEGGGSMRVWIVLRLLSGAKAPLKPASSEGLYVCLSVCNTLAIIKYITQIKCIFGRLIYRGKYSTRFFTQPSTRQKGVLLWKTWYSICTYIWVYWVFLLILLKHFTINLLCVYVRVFVCVSVSVFLCFCVSGVWVCVTCVCCGFFCVCLWGCLCVCVWG